MTQVFQGGPLSGRDLSRLRWRASEGKFNHENVEVEVSGLTMKCDILIQVFALSVHGTITMKDIQKISDSSHVEKLSNEVKVQILGILRNDKKLLEDGIVYKIA